MVGVSNDVKREDTRWAEAEIKELINVRKPLKEKKKTKLRALIQLEQLRWLMQREVGTAVKGWKDQAAGKGKRVETCKGSFHEMKSLREGTMLKISLNVEEVGRETTSSKSLMARREKGVQS